MKMTPSKHTALRLFLAFLPVGFQCIAGFQAPRGEVYGIVVDESGRPLEKMKVFLNRTGPGIAVEAIPEGRTSASGYFSILQVEFGSYFLSVEHKNQGYGNTRYDFFRGARSVPKVVLNPEHRVVRDVKIVVGPKGGFLTGQVKQKGTGDFQRAVVRGWLVRQPSYWAQSGIAPYAFVEVFPSGVPFGFSVEAPGYKTWYYSDPTTRKNSITLAPSEVRSLGEIFLVPLTENDVKPKQPGGIRRRTVPKVRKKPPE